MAFITIFGQAFICVFEPFTWVYIRAFTTVFRQAQDEAAQLLVRDADVPLLVIGSYSCVSQLVR